MSEAKCQECRRPICPGVSDSDACAKLLETALRNKLAALEAENAKLKAVVDKLPKTADGVPMVPGMPVFERKTDGSIHEFHLLLGFVEGNCFYDIIEPNWADKGGLREYCYSTEAAARIGTKEV